MIAPQFQRSVEMYECMLAEPALTEASQVDRLVSMSVDTQLPLPGGVTAQGLHLVAGMWSICC